MPEQSQPQTTPFMHLDEFIKYAEEMSSDIGPMFGRDAARLARAYRELEEQYQTALEALRHAPTPEFVRDEARRIHMSDAPRTDAYGHWYDQVRYRALSASNPASEPDKHEVTFRDTDEYDDPVRSSASDDEIERSFDAYR